MNVIKIISNLKQCMLASFLIGEYVSFVPLLCDACRCVVGGFGRSALLASLRCATAAKRLSRRALVQLALFIYR